MPEQFDEWQYLSDEEIENNRIRGDWDGKVFHTWLRDSEPMFVWFLTDPTHLDPTDQSDWVNYRELNTFGGLITDDEIPDSLRSGIQVFDYRVVENPVTGKREYEYDNNLDPLVAGDPGRQIWKPVKGNTDKNGLVTAKWRCAINIVNAVTGYHNILVVSPAAKKSLKKYFRTKNEQRGFDITERPYRLIYSGKGFQWEVATDLIREDQGVKLRLDKSDPEALTYFVQPELPEPINIGEHLLETRDEADAWIASLRTGSGQPVNTSLPDDHFMSEKSTDKGLGGLDVFGEDKPKADETLEKFRAMSPARLRILLEKAGVTVPRGIARDDLAELAAKEITVK
jgi:hypothetical protein